MKHERTVRKIKWIGLATCLFFIFSAFIPLSSAGTADDGWFRDYFYEDMEEWEAEQWEEFFEDHCWEVSHETIIRDNSQDASGDNNDDDDDDDDSWFNFFHENFSGFLPYDILERLTVTWDHVIYGSAL